MCFNDHEYVRLKMPIFKPVHYKDYYLGDLELFKREDWKNSTKEPDEKDFSRIRVYAAQKLMHETLERYPMQFHDSEPEIPWPILVLQTICESSNADVIESNLEEKVIQLYLEKHGVNQFIKIWGGDPQKLLEQIDNMIELENG
jgi:hypothetical protein